MPGYTSQSPTLYHTTLSSPSSLTLTRMSDITSELACHQPQQGPFLAMPVLPLNKVLAQLRFSHLPSGNTQCEREVGEFCRCSSQLEGRRGK